MKRALFVVYGVVAYAVFLVAFLGLIGFVEGVSPWRTLESGPFVPAGEAVLVNLGLLVLFAVQHSGMARRGVKRVLTAVVPSALERSTYVLVASASVLLLVGCWRAMPSVVWSVESGPARGALYALSGLGWGIALFATVLLNHFELFGLRQVWLAARRRELPSATFRTPLLYKLVRHPLYLGFVIAFWAAPTMSVGRLLFAAVTTAYILVAIQLEERDLTAVFGDRYRDYRRRVSMLIPIPRAKAAR